MRRRMVNEQRNPPSNSGDLWGGGGRICPPAQVNVILTDRKD